MEQKRVGNRMLIERPQTGAVTKLGNTMQLHTISLMIYAGLALGMSAGIAIVATV